MVVLTEKFFVKYLRDLPDDTIIDYYRDVDITPFPFLVLKEYQKRFKKSSKKDLIENLTIQAAMEKVKSTELKNLSKITQKKTSKRLKKEAEQMRRKSLEISKLVSKGKSKVGKKFGKATKNIGKNKKEDLELLEKLGELKKSGVITQKEFQQKKKKLLEKI